MQFDIRAFGANALIMVIHSDRQRALRIFLTDDVLIELGLDLRRTQQRFGLRRLIDLGHILVQNIIAKLDALIADENAGSGDQAAHLLRGLTAEGALRLLDLTVVFGHSFTSNSFICGEAQSRPRYRRQELLPHPGNDRDPCPVPPFPAADPCAVQGSDSSFS